MSIAVKYGTIIFVTLVSALVGLSIILGLDAYMDKRRKRIFIAIIVLVFLQIMQNLLEHYFAEYRINPFARTVFAVLGYSLRPAILTLFAHLLLPQCKHTVSWVLVAINAVMYASAFFTDIVFTVRDNLWRGGPLHFWCMLTSGILLAYIVGIVIFHYKTAQWKDIVFHGVWISMIIAAVVVDSFWNAGQLVDYLTVAMVTVSVFSYLWFHNRFVKEYEADIIEKQRMRLVLSQVQPHFIYNTLSSIRNIEGNPDETKRAITEFANYIRGSLAALDGKERVPFSQEISFVKDYVALQQRRFPDHFVVKYDIQDEDFSIPPLTVQILVENAIKHGILVRYDPGTITIHSHSDAENHIVYVGDDGVGFDTETLEKNDRVGLRAVRNRLEYFLGGTVTVESEIGQGTTVTLTIPRTQLYGKEKGEDKK